MWSHLHDDQAIKTDTHTVSPTTLTPLCDPATGFRSFTMMQHSAPVLSTSITPSLATCQAQCVATPACLSVAWRTDDNRCFTMDTLESPSTTTADPIISSILCGRCLAPCAIPAVHLLGQRCGRPGRWLSRVFFNWRHGYDGEIYVTHNRRLCWRLFVELLLSIVCFSHYL